MTLLYQNVRSLKNKLLDLKSKSHSSQLCPDIIVFSETKLQDDVHNSELGLVNFNIHRQDRSPKNNPSQRGGGVMICTKKHLNAVPIILDDCNVELCPVRIKLQALNVIIVAAYLPHASTALPSAAMSAEFDSLCTYV